MAALTGPKPLKLQSATPDRSRHDVLAASTIYLGGMVGIQRSTGYARAFVSGDDFAGHAHQQVDNSAGASGDKTVETLRGAYYAEVSVTGVVRTTQIGAPVYASNDQDLTLTGDGGADLVGSYAAFVSAGVAVVRFEVAQNNVGTSGVVVLGSAAYTATAADHDKLLIATVVDTVITLPATVAGLKIRALAGIASTTTGLSLSPAAADQIIGNGFTAADDKDAVNTAATDVVGDMLELTGDGDDGWYTTLVKGTWARET